MKKSTQNTILDLLTILLSGTLKEFQLSNETDKKKFQILLAHKENEYVLFHSSQIIAIDNLCKVFEMRWYISNNAITIFKYL